MESLTRQLDEARQEHDFRRREAEETRQRNGTLARENGRLLTQVQDMGRQVTALTVEVEASRSGAPRMRSRVSDASSSSASALNNQSSVDAEGVINDRLLTFRDVDELQKKNIELLAVVRELSSSKEAVEDREDIQKTKFWLKEKNELKFCFDSG